MNSQFVVALVRSAWLISIPWLSVAHAAAGPTKSQSSFVSPADRELSVKSVAVAPFTDNVSGIYSRPLTDSLRESLANDPRWNLVPFPARATKPETFEDDRAEAQKILKEVKADALITGRILKGPAGLTLRLVLFVGPSGWPIAVEEETEPTRFETDRMKTVLHETFRRLRDRLPYRGVVMSRRGQEVTINLGQKSGMRDGMTVDLIQILQVRRHPKLHILIGTEREILGKIRIFKSDEELSFGNVIYEKEPGLIEPGVKVLPEEGVTYPVPPVDAQGKAIEDLANRGDKDLAFGDKPVAWLPEPPPQYGRVQVLAGLGQYNQTVALTNAGATSGNNNMTPNLGFMAEGWINREWWLGFDIRQSQFTVGNLLSGSGPGKVNVSLGKYDVTAGYNFLLGNDFFGPKIQAGLGLSKFSSRVDATTPPLFSNMDFGGPTLLLNFNTPIGDDPWDVGARFRYYISPTAGESLSSGARTSVRAMDFALTTGYRVRRNFRYIGELNFENYSADFDGLGDRPDPVTNITHQTTTVMAGLEYSF